MKTNLSEAAVLGACLIDAKAYWRIADLLQPRDFSSRAFADLYAEIRERAGNGDAIDPLVLGDEMPQLRDTIAVALGQDWRRANVRAYAEVVQKAAIERRVRQAGHQIAHLDGDDVLGQAQELLAQCSTVLGGSLRHIREFAQESFADVEARLLMDGDLTGIPTGIPELDQLTGGLQPTDLIVLAARPSVGKTALALQIARHAARHSLPLGKHIGIFSLEMAGRQIHDRLVAAAGEFNGKLLRTPKQMDDSDWLRYRAGMEEISQLPIFIDDLAGQSVESICARIRQCHARTPFSLIVIDYLQLIALPKADRTDLAIGKITQALKNLAKELRIPIILLSQLNRDGDNVRPTMKHLRDSGSIEADADVIMFLWRPDDTVRDYLEAVLGKHRNGETADLALHFNGAHQKFSMATQRPPSVKSTHARLADHYWDESERESF